jgi:hypothetical protein
LRSYLQEKLEGQHYLTLSQFQQLAVVQENQRKNVKEIVRPPHRDVHFLENNSDSSDDQSNDVLSAEFTWPTKAKPYACELLKLIHRLDDMKFTFDVAVGDRLTLISCANSSRYARNNHVNTVSTNRIP